MESLLQKGIIAKFNRGEISSKTKQKLFWIIVTEFLFESKKKLNI